MKKELLKRFVCAMVIILSLPSCLKEGDTTVLVNDPQEIPFITDYLPEDLLLMFGENNVHFGDQPPVVELEFKSQHEYVATNLQLPYAPQVGGLSPITYYHKLSGQYLQITNCVSMNSEEACCKLISPVYMTGHGNDFTAYFYESPRTKGSPEHAVLMSGTLTDAGVRNFIYGYKILKYNDTIVPSMAYPVNSIFIMKDWDGMAETCHWYNDSLFNPKNR